MNVTASIGFLERCIQPQLDQVQQGLVAHPDVENEQRELFDDEREQRLVGGFRSDQPVARIVQDGFEHGEILESSEFSVAGFEVERAELEVVGKSDVISTAFVLHFSPAVWAHSEELANNGGRTMFRRCEPRGTSNLSAMTLKTSFKNTHSFNQPLETQKNFFPIETATRVSARGVDPC